MGARPFLLLILSLYLLLAFGYSVINPLFEAPDEYGHYFTAQYIAETGELPTVAEDHDEWLGQEAAQPPLYYMLGAGLISHIDTTGAREQVWLNPVVTIGDASALTNVNRVVHTAIEAWPWRNYVLAAHGLRGLSVLLGLGTLLCVYGSGRLLWPSDPRKALLATALVAFLPQFGFIHGSITNDTLITFLSAAAIWQVLRLWLVGVTRRRLLLLGVTIGLAALAKNAGVLLLAYAVVVLLLLALRNRCYRLTGETALFVVLPVLLIAGWLWWRNWTLYGDFTATNQFIRSAGGDREYSLLQVLGESSSLWLSFFAVFGWFNVRAPEWIYSFWNGLVALAVVGAIWANRKIGERRLKIKRGTNLQSPWRSSTLLHKRWLPAVLLAIWFLAVYAGLLLFMLQTRAAQGRLLFPALLPLALGLVYGLSRWPWRGVYWLLPLLAFFTSFYALFFVIRPIYARPPIITELPPYAVPLGANMGRGMQLVGAHIATTMARPGDLAWFTLYWQAESIPTEPLEFVLELFGRDEAKPIAKLHSYHGRGLYPANLWPEKTLIADRFAVRLDEEINAPVLAQAFVRLVGDNSPSIAVGTVKVVPAAWPVASNTTLALVGQGIELRAVSLNTTTASPNEQIELAVQWKVTTPPGADFTTLFHLAEADQPPLATGDSPPLAGAYPTHAWAAGEVIEDTYTLTVPPTLPDGRYPMWLGMYNPASPTLERLSLTIDGVRQPNDVYLVGWVEIVNYGCWTTVIASGKSQLSLLFSASHKRPAAS